MWGTVNKCWQHRNLENDLKGSFAWDTTTQTHSRCGQLFRCWTARGESEGSGAILLFFFSFLREEFDFVFSFFICSMCLLQHVSQCVCVYLLIYSFNCVCMDWLIFLERGVPLSPLNTSVSLEGNVTTLSHTPNCEGQARSSIQSSLPGCSLCRAGQRGVYSHRLPAPPLSVWLVKEWSTSAGEYNSEIMFYSETLL